MRPKTRGMAWTGVQHGLAGERVGRGGGIIRDLERSVPHALAVAAQLRATGNDSWLLFSNKCCQRTVNTKIPQAGRDKTLVDPL